jgi:hypothetical protein
MRVLDVDGREVHSEVTGEGEGRGEHARFEVDNEIRRMLS